MTEPFKDDGTTPDWLSSLNLQYRISPSDTSAALGYIAAIH